MLRGTFAGNSAMTLAAQLVVAAAAVLCLPVIVGGLGPEAFGLLSLLWMFVGYVTVFDLGVGQAAAKYVTEDLRAGDKEGAARMLRSAFRVSLAVGAGGALLVLGLVIFGPGRIVAIPPDLARTATVSLLLLALGIPATLMTSTLRSVPLAFNRFDVLNGLQLGMGLTQWVGGAAVVAAGGGVSWVVGVTVLGRVAVLAAYGLFCVRTLPGFLRRREDDAVARRRLWRFSGWAGVSQFVPPAVLLMERMIVGGVLSLSALTYFAVPSEIMVRLLLFPASLAVAFFPIISGGWRTAEGRAEARRAYSRSLRLIALVLVPVAAALALFSPEILEVWLGGDFPERSGVVLALMAGGIVFNAAAQLPVAALQGSGRPEVVARLQLVLLPFYAALLYFLTLAAGITGTAIAWVAKVVIEALALMMAGRRLFRDVPFTHPPAPRGGLVLVGLTAGGTLVAARMMDAGPVAAIVAVVAAGVVYAAGAWRFLLDDAMRGRVRAVLTRPGAGNREDEPR